MEAEVFLDSAYAIALAADSDQHHQRAVELSEQLESAKTRIVTTQGVILEIGNALAKPRYRDSAFRLLRSLEADPKVQILPISSSLMNRAILLFGSRSDKNWGLVDCVSFEVMTERGLKEALTSDEHFVQAGFVALLR